MQRDLKCNKKVNTFMLELAKMNLIPNELEWMSLFNTEPSTKEEALPFYYRENIYEFYVEDLHYIIKFFPSMDEFSIKVQFKNEKIDFVDLRFITVYKMEINSDKGKCAKFTVYANKEDDRFYSKIEITIKPNFSIKVIEDFLHNT